MHSIDSDGTGPRSSTFPRSTKKKKKTWPKQHNPAEQSHDETNKNDPNKICSSSRHEEQAITTYKFRFVSTIKYVSCV